MLLSHLYSNPYIVRWLYSTNHKNIGSLYFVFGAFSGVLGFVVSMLMRFELSQSGDAFLAGLISKLISCDYQLNEFEINKFISYASVCGYLTCLGEVAIDPQPDYQKVHQYFGSQIS